MNKFRLTINALAIAVFMVAFASLAQAQATRTWVSGVGDDVNPCSRTAPCKTYAGAISKTAKDGEISTLDPGGFGAVTITKSITIDGTQGAGFGGILAAGTTGVIVNVTAAADVRKTVRLRNLSIHGAATGVHGINALAFSKLFIENCQIFGFQSSAASRGIRVNVTAAGSQVHITDTEVANSASGIDISSSAAFLQFTLDRVRMGGMTDGLIVGSNVNGVARDCVISGMTGVGVKTGSANDVVGLERTIISLNGTGIQPFAGSNFVLSNVTLIGNATGITAGGTITSHGNNQFSFNGPTAAVNVIGQQ